MLPRFLKEDIQIIKEPNLTYRLNLKRERVDKYLDNIESVKQAIYKILNTERYTYLGYDWNYGIELKDLIGKEKSFIKAEIPRRIKEALFQDDRIKDISNFTFSDISKTELSVTFLVELYDFEEYLHIEWGYKA